MNRWTELTEALSLLPILEDNLRQRRRPLMNSICQWTKEKKFPVNKLLARLIERCDQLDLHIKAEDAPQNLQVSAYLTTLVMNHLFTGKFKRTK